MTKHHTKDKGDLGVLKAKVDLHTKGYIILSPETEHAPFDLVAYKENKFHRIQVKYRTIVKGVIQIKMETSWADKHGVHIKPYDRSELDYVCIFCPDTDKCYYINCDEIIKTISLRINLPKNNQSKNINLADNYLEITKGNK